MLYVGIDLGTSAVKLLLMNSGGEILKTVSREYPISFPASGWAEQEPEDWYKESIEGLKELLIGTDKSRLAGISFGGQMHGLVVLDKNDNVIRPAILWNDGRTGKETDYLNNVIGRERLAGYTANIAFAGFTAPKILWMRENEPENFAKIDKIMLPKDYLAYKLSGKFATDVSDASGMLLFDVENRRWSEEMIEICGIKREMLAEVFESSKCIGNVKTEIAEALGIPETARIIAGAGDNAAAAVGTGTVGEGSCNISLGTSGTVFISSSRFALLQNNAIHFFAHADGAYHLMGCMLSAASCNKWWLEEVLNTEDYSGEQEKISKLGQNEVYFLPYLMGERSPHNDPEARGAFIGMTMNTSRSDMTQAILEGVAFALRDSLEAAKSLGIEIKKTRICGGGAKSELWKKIIANVLGIEVEWTEADEGPGYGAAILAAVGCGEYSSTAEASGKIVKAAGSIMPEERLTALYERKYSVFRKLYPEMKNCFSIMAENR